MMVVNIVIALFFIQGCVLLSDEAQDETAETSNSESVTDPKSPQIIAEDNVENYVRQKFGPEVTYKIYNFGQIFRLKKPEQKQLDELRELRALVPGMKDHYGKKTDSVLARYDTLIAQKQREIIQKNIHSDYIISHIFTIKKKKWAGHGV